MSNALPMTTESNLSPPPRQTIDRGTIATILSVVGVQVAVLAILSAQMHRISQQIQSSDSNRQADTRAINSRVDAVQGQLAAHTHRHP